VNKGLGKLNNRRDDVLTFNFIKLTLIKADLLVLKIFKQENELCVDSNYELMKGSKEQRMYH
jgi:hypothetical protein